MKELIKYAMDKAFFDKKNVITLIETFPEHFQEEAFLIATGNWKTPEYCKVGTKGAMNGVTYFVTSFNLIKGVEVQNTKNPKDSCTITYYKNWEKYVNNYKLLMEKRGEEYLDKLHKLQEEYKDLD